MPHRALMKSGWRLIATETVVLLIQIYRDPPTKLDLQIIKNGEACPHFLLSKFTTAGKTEWNGASLGCTLATPQFPVIQFCRATTCCPSKTIRRIKEHYIQHIRAFCIIFLQDYALAPCHLRNFRSIEYQQLSFDPDIAILSPSTGTHIVAIFLASVFITCFPVRVCARQFSPLTINPVP